MWLGYDEPSDLLYYKAVLMKYILIFYLFNGAGGIAVQQDFENMIACQDAKTVMMAHAPAGMISRAYCFPSAR